MPAYVVQRRDPQRIADAVMRYQVTQPRFVLTVVLVLVFVAALGSVRGGGGALLAVVAFAVLIVLVLAVKRGRLARTLTARGFRPGSTLDAAADGDGLTITASTGSGRHPWGEIDHVRLLNGIVLFRLAAARFVVAVPREALPEGVLERIAPRRP